MFYLLRILKENFWWLHSHNRLLRVWIISHHCPHNTVSWAENCFQVNKAFQTQDFFKTEIFLNNNANCELGIVLILFFTLFLLHFAFISWRRERGTEKKMPFHQGWIWNQRVMWYVLYQSEIPVHSTAKETSCCEIYTVLPEVRVDLRCITQSIQYTLYIYIYV